MKAKDLDHKFDDGEDVLGYLDLSQIKKPGFETKRVSIDFPSWMVQKLDKEAMKLGLTRQSVIKFWISEMLRKTSSK
jgi:macrodomain Ter protein organizer (MatP/YcbG family)